MKFFHQTGIFFFSIYFYALLANTPLLAAPATETPITGFTIDQESYRTNGVLVSRPRILDEKIRFLIKLNHITSLESFGQWLERNFTYQRDINGDSWANPEETLERKKGDCEDFAILARAVLKVLGYQSKIIVLQLNQQAAHAICLFQVNGYYCWFDNAILRKTSARSLGSFIEGMAANGNLVAMLELNPEKKEWSMLYQQA
jgi:hypothetical protein